MDKIIKISAKMDTAEFDRAIDAMQKKMRQISAPSEAAKGFITAKERMKEFGVGSGATEADRQRAARMEKESQDRAIRFAKEQMQIVENANKLYDRREKQIQKLNEEIAKGTKNELEARQRITELQKQQTQYAEAAAEATTNVNKALGRTAGGTGGGGGAGGGGTGGGGRGGGFGGFLSGAGFGGLLSLSGPFLAGMIAKQVAERATDLYLNYSRRADVAQGSAIQGLVGEQVSNLFSGRQLENVLFSGERSASLQKARADVQRQEDLVRDIGISNPFSDIGFARIKKNLFESTGGLIGSQEDYLAQINKQTGEYAQQYYQSELNKNPVLTSARRSFMQNYQNDLAVQRLTGMSDEQLNQFLTGGEFTRADLFQNMQGIAGAGGSTAAMKGLTPFAARMAREKDVTNAAELVGMLSRSVSDTQGISNAVMKQFSEAMRLGLDTSETRKFMESSTKLAVSAGARDEEAINRIKASLAAGVAEKTPAGIQAAMAAEQVMAEQSAETTGARGAIQWSSLRSGALGKVDKNILNSFAKLTDKQVMALPKDDPTLLAAARSAFPDLSPEEGVEAVRGQILKTKMYAQDPTGLIDKEISKLRKRINSEFAGSPAIAAKNQSFRADMGRLIGLQSRFYKDMTPEQQLAMATRQLSGEVGMGAETEPTMTTEDLDARLRGTVSKAPAKGDFFYDQKIKKERKGDIAEKVQAGAEAVAQTEVKAASDTLIGAMGEQTQAYRNSAKELLEITAELRNAKTPEQQAAAAKRLGNYNPVNLDKNQVKAATGQ
jgi:hypothetical protein